MILFLLIILACLQTRTIPIIFEPLFPALLLRLPIGRFAVTALDRLMNVTLVIKIAHTALFLVILSFRVYGFSRLLFGRPIIHVSVLFFDRARVIFRDGFAQTDDILPHLFHLPAFLYKVQLFLPSHGPLQVIHVDHVLSHFHLLFHLVKYVLRACEQVRLETLQILIDRTLFGMIDCL